MPSLPTLLGNFVRTGIFCAVCGCFGSATGLPAPPVQIDVWYGPRQSFGHLGGHPQRWVNLLGNVSPVPAIQALSYRLNDSGPHPLSFREADKRLARPGDFNVEILRSELKPGDNTVLLAATTLTGEVITSRVVIDYHAGENSWPLPYVIDWTKAKRIADVAQVVDGKWKITDQGVRTVEKFYDRVIALGDASWKNYEVSTTVTIHSLTPPKTGPSRTNVTHAAIATRWPGHEADGHQPSVKWYPVGATAEFRLEANLTECRWRIFDGKKEFYVESTRRRKLDYETPYHMKHRVETLGDGRSRYRVKLWPAGTAEPATWDLERFETDDLPSGSALLIAHHADVTFGNVSVVPIPEHGQ